MSSKRYKLSAFAYMFRAILAGITFGTLLGLIYFLIEPVMLNQANQGYFGEPMSRILFVYLLFGVSLGVLASLAAGIIHGFSRQRLLSRPGPAVFAITGFLFTLLFIMRQRTLSHLGSFQVSLYLPLLLALLIWGVLALIWSRPYAGGRRPGRGGAGKALIFTLLAAVFIAGVYGWDTWTDRRGLEAETASADTPNVVLIVVDALRADHLSCYGYERETSPNIDRLAEQGVLFKRSYSHGNRTVIAMPSLFTSLYPTFHGLLWSNQQMIPLPESRKTLAEVFQSAGYVNVGMMSNTYLKKDFGMTQGFDRVDEFNSYRLKLSVYRVLRYLDLIEPLPPIPDAAQVTDKALEWLGRIYDRPFFLFMHYMDVHHEYNPPLKYENMFRSPASSDLDAMVLFNITRELVSNNERPFELSDQDLSRLVDLYDGCIRYTDAEIGRFLEYLESLPIDRETIVILTADHGDEFLEHGMLYHTNYLVEELLRVPLIIWHLKDQGKQGQVDKLVRHIDVLPTVCDWLGVEKPKSALGRSLRPLIEGGDVEWDEELFAEGQQSSALIIGKWKVLYLAGTDSYQLFDLSRDPLGHNDLSLEYPEMAARMKSKIDEYLKMMREVEVGEGQNMSKEILEQLRTLGYIN